MNTSIKQSSYLVDIQSNSYGVKFTHLCKGTAIIEKNIFGVELKLFKENENDPFHTYTLDDSFNFKEECARELDGSIFIESRRVIIGLPFEDEEPITSNIYKLVFDRNSCQAQRDMVGEIDKYKKMNLHCSRYESGKPHICGTFVDGKPEGECIEYYNNSFSAMKYCGEFSEGEYDGAGIFYSRNGNICIKINNIVENVPNGIATIEIINLNGGKVAFSKSFNIDDLGENFNMDLKSENFCYSVAKHFYSNIDNILFETLSADEKMNIINKKMNVLGSMLTEYIKESKISFWERVIKFISFWKK